MSQVKLYRGQIGKSFGIDITAKSSGMLGYPFAPTWDMVMGSKKGTLSWEEYTRRYLEILNKVPETCVRALHLAGLQNGGYLCLQCYCRDGTLMCHTLLCIKWLIDKYPELFELSMGED